MKKILFLLIFVASSCCAQERVSSTWFVPESCKGKFLDYMRTPYNNRDGVAYREVKIQDLPREYEGGVFLEVSHPGSDLVDTSIKANIVSVFEDCTLNASVSFPKDEFDFDGLAALIKELKGGDDMTIKIMGDKVIVYFSRKL